jgi:alkanesulfonate monooxygenase SsuD/methylene tetrahydromethanopterin reductase-like flavin-dependent oxidoreductase (luciferase family)
MWLPENHFGENALPDPLTMLAAVAGVTSTLQLGTTSYLLTLRNPLQAAEQVAVLDQLCQGRVLLGIGRGYAPDMLRAFHVPPQEKRKIFAWSLNIMRDAWAGKPVTLDGNEEHAVIVHPRPFQDPHPPLMVAAFGPKALAQAGRLGLPYLSSPMESLATLQTNYKQHVEAADHAGMTRPTDVPVMRTVFVSEDSSEIARIRGAVAERSDNARLSDGEGVDDWTIIGDLCQVREQLQRYREVLGMTHLVATRLRVAGIPEPALRTSVRLLAETVAGL